MSCITVLLFEGGLTVSKGTRYSRGVYRIEGIQDYISG